MKRLAVILAAVVVPVLSVHLLLAAGFFKVGEKAPSFALNAISGEPVSLDAYKGKVVVLGLFHICDPCMMQGTNLQKVYEATQGKMSQLSASIHPAIQKRRSASFSSAFPVKVTYPYLLDPGKVTDKLYGGGKFIPNVYVIDQQGVIRWQRVGNMELAGADVRKSKIAEVENLLATGSSTQDVSSGSAARGRRTDPKGEEWMRWKRESRSFWK